MDPQRLSQCRLQWRLSSDKDAHLDGDRTAPADPLADPGPDSNPGAHRDPGADRLADPGPDSNPDSFADADPDDPRRHAFADADADHPGGHTDADPNASTIGRGEPDPGPNGQPDARGERRSAANAHARRPVRLESEASIEWRWRRGRTVSAAATRRGWVRDGS